MYYTGNTSPRDFSVYGSIGDFDDADCWSQEDDEIMQVIMGYLSQPSKSTCSYKYTPNSFGVVNAMSTSGFKPVSGVITCVALAKAGLVMDPLHPSIRLSVRPQHFLGA